MLRNADVDSEAGERDCARKMALSRMEEKAKTCAKCEQVMPRLFVKKMMVGRMAEFLGQ